MSDVVGTYLVEQIREKDQIIAAMMTAKAATWDQGFSAACAQWSKQQADETHPITRNNPYAREDV